MSTPPSHPPPAPAAGPPCPPPVRSGGTAVGSSSGDARPSAGSSRGTTSPRPSRIPRVVHNLASAAPAVPAPATGREALDATYRLLGEAEIETSTSLDSGPDSVLRTLVPGLAADPPVLVRGTGAGDPPLTWEAVTQALQLFRALVSEFGTPQLVDRARNTSHALGVALHWVGVLANSVCLLEGALRRELAAPRPAEVPASVTTELKSLKHQNFLLLVQIGDLEAQINLLEKKRADDAKFVEETKKRDDRREKEMELIQKEVRELEECCATQEEERERYRRIAEAWPGIATLFVSNTFGPANCDPSAVFDLMTACSGADSSVKDRLMLLVAPRPGTLLPAFDAAAAAADRDRDRDDEGSGPRSSPGGETPGGGGSADAGSTLEPSPPPSEESPGKAPGTSTGAGGAPTGESGPAVETLLLLSEGHSSPPHDEPMPEAGPDLGDMGGFSPPASPGVPMHEEAPDVVEGREGDTAPLSPSGSELEVEAGTESEGRAREGPPPGSAARRPATSPPPSPKRVRHGPYVGQVLPQLQAGVRAYDLDAGLTNEMLLEQRYEALRKSLAYKFTLPYAFVQVPRRHSAFKLVPTDLSYSGREVMGENPELPALPGSDDKKLISRTSWHGQPMQFDKANSRGYPSYLVLRDASRRAFDSYGPEGWRHFLHLADLRPWDTLWQFRVKRLYLLDPSLMDADCERWLVSYLHFMFLYRQSFWEHLHWIHAPKHQSVSNAIWSALLRQRESLAGHFARAWGAFMQSRPKTWSRHFDELLESEPAFWFRPKHHCTWFPDVPPDADVTDEGVLLRQLPDLHREEPIRAQFGTDPGRFIESLGRTGQCAFLMHLHVGASWAVPDPWADPEYCPLEPSVSVAGTPGPQFYDVTGEHAALASRWDAQCTHINSLTKLEAPALLRGMSVPLTGVVSESKESEPGDTPAEPGSESKASEPGDASAT